MKTQHVKVLRAFLIDGKPQKPDAVVEVSFGFAVELRNGNKVAFVDPPEVKKPEAKPVETKPSLTAATPQKGVK